MNTFFKNTLLIAAITLSSNLLANVPAETMAKYQAGLQGDADANQQAINELESLSKNAGADPVVMSLLGSSETTQARYVDKPWQKMKIAEKGLAKLDKALSLLGSQETASPKDSLQVNTIAGCTFVKVPQMFSRFEQGYEILTKTIASKAFAYMPPQNQVSTYMCAAHAATLAKDKEIALGYFAAITKIAPEGPHIAQLIQLRSQLEE